MRPLDRKLGRELWRLRAQVLAIAMVLASGVSVLVMSLSTLEALENTTAAYYERYRFADVFAAATRVPEPVAGRIAAIPGVQQVQTRISRYALLDIPGFDEPVRGLLTSVPGEGQPRLNQLVLRSGRWLDPADPDEAIINEPLADAHGLALGDRFFAVINGHRRALTVVGTALSPEFIYSLGPGAILPDDRRFGVIWMGRDALAAAYDLKSAFNDVTVSLWRGTAPEQVVDRIDGLLEPYGGVNAVARADQLSNWFVMNEIDQIRTMVTILPTIFLAVAAFLGHMVLGRLIATERAEIGLLKAFGYSHLEVGWHYAKLVLAIALIGAVIGSLLGTQFGRYNTEIYAEFFRFPLLIYRASATGFLIAVAVSLLAMLVGALGAVQRAIRLPPAEAMRPPAPTVYRRHVTRSGALARWIDQPTRIALRQIARWPVRAALTSIGIGLSVGLLIMSLQWNDTIERIAQTYFYQAQHQTLTLGLAEPQPLTVAQELARLPGVMAVEPSRVVSATLSSGSREHRGAITGIARGNRLRPLYDEARGTTIAVPASGLVLGTYLADSLDVRPGDRLWVEVREGRRPSGWQPVVGVVESSIAMPAYMDLDALNRWLRVRPTTAYLDLLVDPLAVDALFAELKQLPMVTGIGLRQAAIESFHATLGEHLLMFVAIFTGFAGALGFGVAYNSARIALSERGRELATLRVLGFTRGETAYVLLAELALLVAAALPLGCLLGWGLVLTLSRAFDTELFRMPFALDASTYGVGVVLALVGIGVSAALVRRRVQRLDLIRVLKTRE